MNGVARADGRPRGGRGDPMGSIGCRMASWEDVGLGALSPPTRRFLGVPCAPRLVDERPHEGGKGGSRERR